MDNIKYFVYNGDKMFNPKVSIGIPSYNHEKYISETIESILNQTFQDFEIIITDDGSSDKTVEVIKEFSDPRIKIFTFKQNQGACKALNNCIINSQGKYFAYVSSDDVWELDKLEKQVKYLDENPQTPLVFTKVKIIDENSEEFMEKDHPYYTKFDQKNRSRSKWLRYFFYKGNCICHPSIMIRKDVYDDVGFYNERMANLPDWDMWVRICLKYNFHILDEKLTKFRIRDDEKNVSGNTDKNQIRGNFERVQVFDHFLEIDDVNFFLEIFPESEKFGPLKPDMIPYFLARLAYETNQDWKQLWALNTLYGFMQSNNVVNQLKNYYNFNYPDFLEMSAAGDFFKITKIKNMDNAIRKRDAAIRQKNLLIDGMGESVRDKNLLNKKLNNLIKEKNEESKDIDSQIESLFQIQYECNYNRSFIQRFFSKFPSLNILINKNNNIKHALINIKGYNAIKEGNLFDVGYYLKNNPDIRNSGIDPLIHYIYNGFKEERNPNPII